MDLSIIVPVFNESNKITADIKAALFFVKNNHLNGEIIVVDDGSTDNTCEVAKATHSQEEIELKVLSYNKRKGKGFAVRTGMQHSNGEIVMFVDSGNCVPFKYSLTGMEMLKSGICDIAHGSRKLAKSRIVVPQAWYRKITSVIFRRFMMFIFKIPPEFTDTQCGFKIYKGDLARKLYGDCVSDGFLFDIEIILRALKQGYRIHEFPIEWTTDRDSRLSQALNFSGMIAELRKLKQVISQI